MRKIACFLIPFLVLVVAQSHAQTPKLCLYFGDSATNAMYNPGSVMIDTCRASPTYRSTYIRQGIRVIFDSADMLNLPWVPADSDLEVSWTAIDTSFSQIRAAFEKIYDSIGPFTLRKIFPSDTSTQEMLIFEIKFPSYTLASSVLPYVQNVPGMLSLNPEPQRPAYIPNDQGLAVGTPITSIQTGSQSTCKWQDKSFHKLGWQWSLYKIKCPMAWEITTGSTDNHPIFLADNDGFASYGTSPITASDVSTRTPSNTRGNFLQLDPTHAGTGDVQDPGDTRFGTNPPYTYYTYPFAPGSSGADDHGVTILPFMIGAANNANFMNKTGVMAGVAFGATGLAIDEALNVEPAKVDVDNTSGNGVTHIDVVNNSNGSSSWTGSVQVWKDAIDDGIVAVMCAGNSIYEGESWGAPMPPFVGPAYIDANGHPVYYIRPSQVYPAATVWPGTTPNKDVKVIAVGGLEDGTLITCPHNSPGCLIDDYQHWSGDVEQFPSDWTFSPGKDKFETSTDRSNAKERAYMDLVAPAVDLLSITTDGGYRADISGTSFAAPLVAGVVGLMRSVNKWLTSDGNTPSDLDDVQRNAYDILTFTADKIPDVQNWSTGEFPYGPYYYQQPATGDDGNSYQLNYVNQGPNDPLNRAWAQRMGFGQVNAYRAVANSIPLVGNHSYTTSSNIFDFVQLMHFGAWYDDNNRCLSWVDNGTMVQGVGGHIIPNQEKTAPFQAWQYSNQGETLINSSDHVTPTVLTVAGDDIPEILAIDGLVEQTDATKLNNIIRTPSDPYAVPGTILMTGYLEDVEITGTTTKVDDLIIYSDNSLGYSKVEVDAGQTSEIYGKVQLQGGGNYVVNGGNLTIQPGGEIDMNGDNDFVIKSGTVTMEASSKIASSTKQVIVDNGANLVIAGSLPVDILCNLYVRSGGTVTINSGAYLRLDQFRVDQGGTFTCLADSRLTLNKVVNNYCYGFLNFHGFTDQGYRITLTGGVSECGSVTQYAGIVCVCDNPGLSGPGNAKLLMTGLDDSDVFIVGHNVPKAWFFGDNFSANQSFNNGSNSFGPAFLRLYNDKIWPQYPSIEDASVSGCRFFDEDPSAPNLDYFVGLEAENLRFIGVVSSYFYNTFVGIETSLCPSAFYINNSFGINIDPQPYKSNVGPLAAAILDYSSGAMYCTNQVSNCMIGINATNDLYGALFDNTLTGSVNAVPGPTLNLLYTFYGGRYDLRNNTFNNYPIYGAYSYGIGNVISLRDVGLSEYGRNFFTHGPSAGPPWLYTADLARRQQGVLAVACGLNTVGPSSPTHFHLANLDYGYPPWPTIEVGSNDWVPGIISTSQFAPVGVPQNLPGGSAAECGPRTDANQPSCDVPFSTVPYDPFPCNADWLTADSSGPALRSDFWNASGMLISDTNDENTKRSKARDEVWAASLIDSSTKYLPMALNDLNTVLADPTTSPELKSSLWLMKAQVNEMLGMPDSSVLYYDAIIQQQFIDSVAARWGLQRLAIPTDTVTDSSASAMFTYMQRKVSDLVAMVDTIAMPDSGGGYKIASHPFATDTASMELTVHPNPSSNYARICVTDLPAGTPVTLIVVNEAGQIVSTLYNATPDAELGLCCTLDCSKLPNGTYFARLWNDTLGQSVKLSIQH